MNDAGKKQNLILIVVKLISLVLLISLGVISCSDRFTATADEGREMKDSKAEYESFINSKFGKDLYGVCDYVNPGKDKNSHILTAIKLADITSEERKKYFQLVTDFCINCMFAEYESRFTDEEKKAIHGQIVLPKEHDKKVARELQSMSVYCGDKMGKYAGEFIAKHNRK